MFCKWFFLIILFLYLVCGISSRVNKRLRLIHSLATRSQDDTSHRITQLGEIIWQHDCGVIVTQILEDALLTHSCLPLPLHTAPGCLPSASSTTSSRLCVAAAYAARCCGATTATGSARGRAGHAGKDCLRSATSLKLLWLLAYPKFGVGVFPSCGLRWSRKTKWLCLRAVVFIRPCQIPCEAVKNVPRRSDKIKMFIMVVLWLRGRKMRGMESACVLFYFVTDPFRM